MQKVNRKRRRSEWARAYGSPGRVEFVKSLGCVVCGATPSENAHTVTGGMGRKADAKWIVPLCHWHHRELHSAGKFNFERRYMYSLDATAVVIEEAWQRHLATRTA